MTIAYLMISYYTFREYEIEDCRVYSKKLTELIADDIIDVESIDEFLEQGRDYPGYAEIERKLYKLRDAYPDIVYLYAYQVREDGFHVVFDLNTDKYKGTDPGDVEPFSTFPAFEKYIPDLLAGKEIPPLFSNEEYGNLLTVYTPVYDSQGACICYIGADCSMEGIKEYSGKVFRQIALFFLVAVGIILIISIFVTENRVVKKMKGLENRAYLDTLTGLQNRTAFYEHLEEINKKIKAGNADFSTLMIDVNYLKRVNDTYGHDQGNIYLQGAADLIRKTFGAEKNLYRIGGDEFVLLLEGKEQEGVEDRIRAFKEEVARLQADDSLQPWEKVSAAVGISKYEAGKEDTAEEVFRLADEAMYADKVAMKAVRTD